MTEKEQLVARFVEEALKVVGQRGTKLDDHNCVYRDGTVAINTRAGSRRRWDDPVCIEVWDTSRNTVELTAYRDGGKMIGYDIKPTYSGVIAPYIKALLTETMNTSRKMTEKEVGWFLDVERVLRELGSNIDVEGAFRYLDNTIDILQLNVADSSNNPPAQTLLIMVNLEDKRTVMRVNRKGTDILDFYISPDYDDGYVRELVGEIDRRCRFILNLYKFVVSNAPAQYAGSKTYHEFRTDSTRVIYLYSTRPEIGTLRVVEGATTYVLANIAHGSVLTHKIVVGPWMEEMCHDIESVEGTNEEIEMSAKTAGSERCGSCNNTSVVTGGDGSTCCNSCGYTTARVEKSCLPYGDVGRLIEEAIRIVELHGHRDEKRYGSVYRDKFFEVLYRDTEAGQSVSVVSEGWEVLSASRPEGENWFTSCGYRGDVEDVTNQIAYVLDQKEREESERYAETVKEVCLPEPEEIRVSDPFRDLEKAIESENHDEMCSALASASCELLRLYAEFPEGPGSVSYSKDSIRFDYDVGKTHEQLFLFSPDNALLFRAERAVGGAWGLFDSSPYTGMFKICVAVQNIIRLLRGTAYPYGIREIGGRTALVGYGSEPTKYADEFVHDFIDRCGAEHFLQWVCKERKRVTRESYHVLAYLNCEVSVQVYSYCEQATIKGTV